MENFRNLNDELTGFNGADEIYKHRTGQLFTSGIHEIREQYECYWLIDEILFSNFKTFKPTKRGFYCWTLERIFENGERTDSFNLKVDDGNRKILASKVIPFSDFKADKFTLWFENNLLMLPTER